jgi:predicted ATPase
MQWAIREACQNETDVLEHMIPALSAILDYCPDPNPNNANPLSTSGVIETKAMVGTANGVTQNPPTSSPFMAVAEDVIQRFVFVLQTFLRAISSLEQPVVLCLEDLQYADPCSVDVLCCIMNDLRHLPGLMVMGTYNTIDENELFQTQSSFSSSILPILDPKENRTKMQANLHSSTATNRYFVERVSEMERGNHELIRLETVHIPNFNVEQVNVILRETLQLCTHFEWQQVDSELCHIVMERTNGNIYRLVEFVHWLQDNDLIMTRCPTHCSSVVPHWTWSVVNIRRAVHTNHDLSVMVVNTPISLYQLYTANRFENLSPDLIEVLKVGACLGCSRIQETLIEYILNFPIRSVLAEAVDLGIFVKLYEVGDEGKQQYMYGHENLQHYVYSLITENSHELYHFEIGHRLWRRFDDNELDRNIFVVMSQMYLGRRWITRYTERYKIAALCLRAGRKAAKSSTFRMSLTYFKFGIELLGEWGWRHKYELTLIIYNAAAEMEVCNNNYEGMEVLLDAILLNSRCVDDKIQARTTQVYAHGINDRQQESLDLGIQLLAEIGHPFPHHLSQTTMRREMKSVLLLLKGKSNEYLKRLPVMEDAKVLAAMQVLNLVSLCFLLLRIFVCIGILRFSCLLNFRDRCFFIQY